MWQTCRTPFDARTEFATDRSLPHFPELLYPFNDPKIAHRAVAECFQTSAYAALS